MSASIQNEISGLTKALKIGSGTSNPRLTRAGTKGGFKTKHDKQGETEPPGQRFTLFSSLPTELRLQIWAYALRRPTLVPVILAPLKPVPFIRLGSVSSNWPNNYHRTPPSIGDIRIPLHISTLNSEERIELDHPSRINLSNLSGFKSTLPPPQLTYVNHEAHEVVTGAFTKAFAAHCAVASTWFNYERDTLLLRMDETTTGTFLLSDTRHNLLEEAFSRIVLAERALVKHICIDLTKCTDIDYLSYMWIGWSVSLFPNCKTFSFELPGTKVVLQEAGEGLRLGGVVQAKRDLFAECFENYRSRGTVRYEVSEWKEYVERVHGEKGVVVRECCMDSLGEDGQCDGDCILMVQETGDGSD